MNYFLVALFLSLFLFTLNLNKIKNYYQSTLVLIIISYIQGFLVASIVSSGIYLLSFSLFVMTALLYYLLVPRLIPIIYKLLKIKSPKTKKYSNAVVNDYCKKLWGIAEEDYSVSIDTESNRFNCSTTTYNSGYNILIGDKLLEITTDEEIIFIFSHEIAHKFNIKRDLTVIFASLMSVYIVTIAIAYSSLIFSYANISFYYGATLALFLLGIIIINRTLWISEYGADIIAIQKTNDVTSAISALNKLSDNNDEKDLGLLLNLITSDHPFTGYRISKIKNFQNYG